MATLIQVVMPIMRNNNNNTLLSCFFIALIFNVSCTAETPDKNTTIATTKGPAFDCNKASTVVEKAVCNSQRLSQLDLTLSDLYKTAIIKDPGIKAEQRKWLKQRNQCNKNQLIACLEKSYMQRIQQLSTKHNNKTLNLPSQWRDFNHSQWVDFLALSNRCSLKENTKHIRFLEVIKINQQHEFLSITCEPGAYQDQSINFLISHSENASHIKEVKFNELYFDNNWKQQSANKVTGYININLTSKQIIITRRYVGSWACGYIAHYTLDDIFKANTLKAISAKADNNCDNGIRRDEWPEVVFAH